MYPRPVLGSSCRRRPFSALALLLAVVTTTAGCASAATPIRLPPEGAAPDYQLGVAYPPPDGVGIVARDRTAAPVPGVYSICYVNAFQTQPGEQEDWPADVPLTDEAGAVAYDPAWPDEALLDTSSAANRARIAEIVGEWIRGCAVSGFDAVEFDNLDTYARSGGALTLDDNLALAAELVDAAHTVGLAAGQKNAAEDAATLRDRAGFDFAVAEECLVFDECGLYTAAYGGHVIAIEYSDTGIELSRACADPSAPASLVLRDRELVGPADDAYVFGVCGPLPAPR